MTILLTFGALAFAQALAATPLPSACAELNHKISSDSETINAAIGMTENTKLRIALSDIDLTLADLASDMPEQQTACEDELVRLRKISLDESLARYGLLPPPAPTKEQQRAISLDTIEHDLDVISKSKH